MTSYRRSYFFAVAIIVILSACSSGGDSGTSMTDSRPIPELTPEQVVEIQLTALRNDAETGVSIAYRFASPNSRYYAETEEEYARIINRSPYVTLITGENLVVGNAQRRNTLAFVGVGVTDELGNLAPFVFVLSRQIGGDFDQCWMTDGVLFVDPSRMANQKVLNTPVLTDA